jgi:uncharacterized protein (TIGR00295 family)
VIPFEGEAIALHRKYGSSERIVRHCQVVANVAVALADEFRRKEHPVDVDAVRAAALLHDIGRSKTQTVWHGLEGSRILEKEGIDPKVVEIVRKHVGAGISTSEAKRLGLPNLDYVPQTLEERIVCFSDKVVSSDKVQPFEEEIRRFKLKSHDVERLLELKKGLQKELGEDPERVISQKIKESR